jgi:tyrocidine synthetase-3
MIIGILGILKSGGAYVPIDGSYPKQRIDFMLKDTKAKRVVSDQLSTSKAFEIINPIKDWSLIEKHPITNPSNKPKPGNLAYIIYTSGSTGQPKGVMIEHQGVVNLIKSQSEYFNIESNERILQFSNYSFDASVEQIFLALSNGASLVMFEEGLQLKSQEFETYLEEQKITHFHATPGFIENLSLQNHKHLKRIIAGGDWCKAELANRYKHQVDFYNEYGPTETTVTAIEYKSDKLDNRTILPIGKALANTSIYILDESEKLQPIGVVGEIYIGGVQVARGYLNNEELTAQKFILNPFNSKRTLV